jgi:microcystin-dependent protein
VGFGQIVSAGIATDAVTTLKILNSNITVEKLADAVQQALVPAGAVQAFAMNSAPSGWLAANGSTIGSASSGATNASADYSALFTVLWDNWTNTLLPILNSAGAASTRGASASADFAANKRLPLPDLRGYFVRGVGVAGQNGTNSDGTASGTFGAKQADALETHTHTVSNGKNVNTLEPASGSSGFNQVWNGFTTATTSGPSTGASTETRPKNIALLYCIKF